jgi:hypothetical protein
MRKVSTTRRYLKEHTVLCVTSSIVFFSKSYMKNYAITGESGEPIATLSACS